MTKAKIINPQPIIDLLNERERVLNEGTIEEVVTLAKTYGVQPIVNSTTIYKTTVARIRDRLTMAGLDPDNLN
jgi:hypothetical protein